MNGNATDGWSTRHVAQLSAILCGALVCLYAASIAYTMARGKAVDFALYYMAAYGFAHGEDIYAIGGTHVPASRAAWDRLAHSAGVGEYAPPYRYPPLTAVVVWPLTYLPPRIATMVWLAASALALIASAWLLGRTSAAPLGVPVALALLLGFVPALVTLYAGQINAFVLLTLCWALHSAIRGRPKSAGAALAIGAMLKVVPTAHLVYFGWRRQWQVAVVGLGVVVACLFISLPLVGWHGLASYGRGFTTLGGFHRLNTAAGNQALSGFFARLLVAENNPAFLVDLPGLAWWLTRLASLAILLATAALCFPLGRLANTVRFEFALVTAAATLVQPYVWYHQLVLLLLPLFVVIDDAVTRRSQRGLLAALLLGYFATGVFGIAWRSFATPVVASMPFYTTLLVWFVLGRVLVGAKFRAYDAAPRLS